MDRPQKQNGRSQRGKESATGNSWGLEEERKAKKRWLDDVEDDLRKTGVKRRIKAMERTEWRNICEAPRVFQDL
jgi:hypothetical protein